MNKYVIKPAIKEINRVTDIIVELSKTKRSGRQIKYLKFSIQEKKQLTLPFSFNEDDKVLNQLSKRLMKLGLKREKVDEILTRHEIDYINKHLNFIENEIKKNKIKSSAAGLFLSALKDDYSVNFNSKSTKDNFSKNHSKFEIRPGIKVLYDNQRFDIVGELGKEYIEFHRGVKMNRDTILDYLTNGQMFIDSDLQKAVN